MSLLLDALKKAAEDKKSKSADAAASNVSEDELDLDLHVDNDSEFPKVDASLPEKTRADSKQAQLDKDAAKATEPQVTAAQPVDSEPPQSVEPKAEVEPEPEAEPEAEVVAEAAQPEDTLAAPAGETGQADVESKPEKELELEMSIDQIIAKDRSQQDKEVLSYLIHKSNQLSDSKKHRSRIMYGALAGMILLVLGIFSYLKLLAVSDQLYTGKPAAGLSQQRPVQSQPSVDRMAQVDTTRAEQQAFNPAAAEPVRSVVSKPAVVAPVAKQQRQVASAATLKQQPIKIIHKQVVDPTDTYLREAYRLFNAGQYDKSRQLYSKVLAREARNRDALLGVAAIDMKQAHFASARQKYLLLLRLNPRDSVARAGLSALASQVDQALDESQLKLMLREQPEAAHLYFALGNIYAADNRWGEAQSAFFSAWSADRQNADYAFNLAVSLDHLGKAKQAIDFYQKSLAMIAKASADVSAATIQTRIDFLQAQHE